MARIPIDDMNESSDQPQTDPDAARGSAAPDQTPGDGSENELQRLRAERDSLFDRLARATADFKNTQRRLEQEMDQRAQYANSSLIKSLLPVIDNFERALAVDPAKADSATILKGMQIVHDQWMNVLKQQQVEEIAPAPGTPFDPNQHQAIMQQDSVYKVPTVVQLLQKGYALHGRTLRPAQVAVSKSV
ncbi:MAG TPA: nucleotide exchange factor GrpE [Tepidisphaeraceae bacterium]|nr:nucleotide exchange factor GrpE [Tepidisphaeraceae bacterium]